MSKTLSKLLAVYAVLKLTATIAATMTYMQYYRLSLAMRRWSYTRRFKKETEGLPKDLGAELMMEYRAALKRKLRTIGMREAAALMTLIKRGENNGFGWAPRS